MEVEKLRAQAGQPAPAPTDHDKLLNAAKELGISTAGKTDEEVRAEVKGSLS